MKEIKEVYGPRKNKAIKGLGIALLGTAAAGAIIGGSNASADEVTPAPDASTTVATSTTTAVPVSTHADNAVVPATTTTPTTTDTTVTANTNAPATAVNTETPVATSTAPASATANTTSTAPATEANTVAETTAANNAPVSETGNPSTNLKDKQSKSTSENKNSEANAENKDAKTNAENKNAVTNIDKSEGEILVPVKSSEELNKAVETAKSNNVEVKTGEAKVVDSSNAAKTELNNQVKVVEKAIADTKAQNDAINAEKEKIAKANKAEEERYQKELKDLEAKTKEEGNFKEVVVQGLTFNNEPESKIQDIKGDILGYYKVDPKNLFVTYKNGDPLEKEPSVTEYTGAGVVTAPVIAPNGSITVTYTDLKNASYDGNKISKVEFTYTNESPLANILYISHTATGGATRISDDPTAKTLAEVKFFDEKGKQIEFTKKSPVAIGVSSLNSYLDRYETVYKTTGKFVEINGSTIKDMGNKAKATRYNSGEYQETPENWDSIESKYFYYGSIGYVQDSGNSVKLKFGNEDNADSGYGHQWFAITGQVAADAVKAPVKKEYTGPQNAKGNVTVYPVRIKNEVPTAEPHKVDLNKNGVNIDGKTVLPGSTNFYKHTWDLDQYKGILADDEIISKGFYYVDDFPEEALTPQSDAIKITDSKGKQVEGVTATVYEALDKAPEAVQNAIKKAGVKVKGSFQVFSADNPKAFFDKYVKEGTNITIIDPMKVKDEFARKGGKYENTAYQLEFGKGQATETVVNNIPKISTHKDVVVDMSSTESLDNKEVALGQTFDYKFEGSLIPAGRVDQLWDYSFKDDWDQEHDEYKGVFKGVAVTDFVTVDKDGKKIKEYKAGDDISDQVEQVVDWENGIVEYKFKEDFLRSVSLDSNFKGNIFMQVTRIKAGTVYNTESHSVNGVSVDSNTVVTYTSEPAKPADPAKPENPQPQPQSPAGVSGAKVLPKTGEDNNIAKAWAGLISFVAGLGLLGFRKKKEDK